MPPTPQPPTPAEQATLQVLYERPSPEGPPVMERSTPAALYARGRGAVIQVVPGPAAFADKIPAAVRTTLPSGSPFANTVRRLPRGEIEVVAFDRTLNDSKLSKDSLTLRASFTDADGARWRVEVTRMAPVSPDPAKDPWYGGVAIDTTLHGDTGHNTPLEPKVRAALAAWGWAEVYKNDARVAASALAHVMVTTDTRDAAHGYAYACYDCTSRPMRQVHLILGPQHFLPSPGGFLHVMWEDAEIRRGTPEQIGASAPALGLGLPDVKIDAVPYLRWSQDTVRVHTGQRYRVILTNNDPVSWHAWHFHGKVAAGGDEGGGQSGHAHGGHEGDAAMDGEARVGSTVIPQVHGQPQLLIPMLQASQWVTTIEFDEPGTYAYGCPVMNHEKRGMKGVFVVDGPTMTHEMTHDAPGRTATHGSAKGER